MIYFPKADQNQKCLVFKEGKGSLHPENILESFFVISKLKEKGNKDIFVYVVREEQKPQYLNWISENKLEDCIVFKKENLTNRIGYTPKNLSVFILTNPNESKERVWVEKVTV